MSFTDDEIQAMHSTKNKTKPQGFISKPKGDRPSICPPVQQPAVQSTKILTARKSALVLSTQSHDAMSALQSAGLQNAAAYVQRKTAERNAIVDKVSDAIAYLSDPDLLEADILAAAAAKVEARSESWGYESDDRWDDLFALPSSSQRLLTEG
jgi:hypothetical protein